MQSNSTVIETITGDKSILKELFGGLSIAPYGIFLLLSTCAFSQGWLHWETNGGPPFLGGVAAWALDKLIRRYYRWKYNFVFDIDKSKYEKSGPPMAMPPALLMIAGILIAWYVDAKLHSQIRWMPLGLGVFVCLRGIEWLRKNWTGYGLIHTALGLLPIGLSVMPLVLGISSNNPLFGLEGIYELTAMGVVIIIVSIMEHLIFLQVQVSSLE